MRFALVLFSVSCLYFCSQAQTLSPLTVDKIMRDPKWMGTQPGTPFWDLNGSTIYFNWNPDNNTSDSIYYITGTNKNPVKATPQEKSNIQYASSVTYNTKRTAYVYVKDGDIFYTTLKPFRTLRITQTADWESNPGFYVSDTKIVYSRAQNLYAWDIATGITEQLTEIKSEGGSASFTPPPAMGRGGAVGRSSQGQGSSNQNTNRQDEWLKSDQLSLFEVLRQREDVKKERADYNKSVEQPTKKGIQLQGKTLRGLNISPDTRFVNYTLSPQPSGSSQSTFVPDYVTVSGYTTNIPARTKVGSIQTPNEFYIYDRTLDTIYSFSTDSIPGIQDAPDYVKDYPALFKKKPENRKVNWGAASWSPDGKYATIQIRSLDNKDKWLLGWDATTKKISYLNRERNEAWVGGPGGWRSGGWINNDTYWFQSEESGYAHIYLTNLTTGKRTQLTSGNYEVQDVQLSINNQYFYIITNEVHPGEKHFYRLHIASGKKERITNMEGANTVVLSPDEKQIAFLHSTPTQPWELYIQANQPNAKPQQITFKAKSDEFKSYPWRQPEVISFTAADCAQVYARIYKPANPHASKPAVLFVHGAGYLQNAHKWWSSYFREYMFNNLLADAGYYVMDIDYRGSAGYGRDWRTGIYRHMGGKDLSDHVDAVKYLTQNFGVNPANIGIYGGSYGGFISLMALFTEPNVFKSGAALRPVTDWAQYNHGYTANILNEPAQDSIAYKRSSPIYFADGLKGNLLMCHGVVDDNVHFQDVVKLSQKLIELGKDNWELAAYPVENHGFVEPSSWTDEYKRILKLFETTLKK